MPASQFPKFSMSGEELTLSMTLEHGKAFAQGLFRSLKTKGVLCKTILPTKRCGSRHKRYDTITSL